MRNAAMVFSAMALLVLACEPSDVHVTSPKASSAFARFVVIGGDLSMGVESGGVVASTQGASWPAIVALDAGVSFQQSLFKAPGCSSPLVAPLLLGRWLTGASSTTRDSSCAGAATANVPPADNLALPGATAWAAMNLTPKLIAASPAAYGALDRARYPLVLASTQSQVTAMIVKNPTFVGIELGSAEVMGAATTGLLVPAVSYTQVNAWNYVPAPVAAPVLTAIADSVAKSGAKAVMLSVPRHVRLPALRPAVDVYNERAALATYGVTVNADCATSAALVNVAATIPSLVQRAITTGAAQPLSCADLPGATDYVLTPSESSTLDGVTTAINAQLKQLAQSHGWAFVDVDAVYAGLPLAASGYSAKAQLTCNNPYGWFFSLDGVHLSPFGQQAIANAVAVAINATYALALPAPGVNTKLGTNPCP